MEIPAGHTIDKRYIVTKSLGHGSAGIVVQVKDGAQLKALKLLKPIQPHISKKEALEIFKQEFSILSRLNHPGVARILDFGFDEYSQKYYFTTEFIDGQDFYSATENLTYPEIEDLIVQVLRALNYLHTRNILHHDIKPKNILVYSDKQNKRKAKIIDFGLAGIAKMERMAGTPAYMAPEMREGKATDSRSDLYSLGVLLYKALTRHHPFLQSDVFFGFHFHRTFKPPLLTQINSNLPDYWDQIDLRLIEPLPALRYPNAASIIREINYLGQKDYEIETYQTRIGYILEHGNFIARKTHLQRFERKLTTFFSSKSTKSFTTLLVLGETGSGKTRLLAEFKYRAQLSGIAVFHQDDLHLAKQFKNCVLLIDGQKFDAEFIQKLRAKFKNQKVFLVWATQIDKSPKINLTTMELKPFTKSQVAEYLSAVTGYKSLPGYLANQIFDYTGGLPLLINELLKNMLAKGLFFDAEGRWPESLYQGVHIDFNDIPPTQKAKAVFLERLKNLSSLMREVLDFLCVVQTPLGHKDLAYLVGINQLQSTLQKLIASGWLRKTGNIGEYSIINPHVKQVLYDQLTPSKARDIHAKFYKYFQSKALTKYIGLYHLCHAQASPVTYHYLLELGRFYLNEELFKDALDLFEYANQNFDSLTPMEKCNLKLYWARSLILNQSYKKAVVVLKALKKDLEIQNQTDSLFYIQVLDRLGDLYTKFDRFEDARKLFEKALKTPSLNKGKTLFIQVENNLASVFMRQGKLDQAQAIFERNYQVWLHEFSRSQKRMVTNNWLASIFILNEDFTEAQKLIHEQINFFQAEKATYPYARAFYVLGDLYFKQSFREDTRVKRDALYKKAKEAFNQSLELADQIRANDLRLRCFNGVGNLEYQKRRLKTSKANYEIALALARRQEDYQTAAAISFNIASIYKLENMYRDAYPYYLYVINLMEQKVKLHTFNLGLLLNTYIELAETSRMLYDWDRAIDSLERAYRHTQTKNYHNQISLFEIFFAKAKVFRTFFEKNQCNEAIEDARAATQDKKQAKLLQAFEREWQAEQKGKSNVEKFFSIKSTSTTEQKFQSSKIKNHLAEYLKEMMQVTKANYCSLYFLDSIERLTNKPIIKLGKRTKNLPQLDIAQMALEKNQLTYQSSPKKNKSNSCQIYIPLVDRSKKMGLAFMESKIKTDDIPDKLKKTILQKTTKLLSRIQSQNLRTQENWGHMVNDSDPNQSIHFPSVDPHSFS